MTFHLYNLVAVKTRTSYNDKQNKKDNDKRTYVSFTSKFITHVYHLIFDNIFTIKNSNYQITTESTIINKMNKTTINAKLKPVPP